MQLHGMFVSGPVIVMDGTPLDREAIGNVASYSQSLNVSSLVYLENFQCFCCYKNFVVSKFGATIIYVYKLQYSQISRSYLTKMHKFSLHYF